MSIKSLGKSTGLKDTLELNEVVIALWQGKWFIAGLSGSILLLSLLYAIYQPNVYRSEALIIPVKQDSSNSISSQFGGLASLAGINIGGGSSGDKVQLALEIMRSRKFVAEFIHKYKILPELMAVKGWDSGTGNLLYDKELYDEKNRSWLREVSPPLKAEPSEQEAYKRFSKIFRVEQDETTGLVRVSIDYYSALIAQKWVSKIIFEINNEMKKRDVNEAIKSQKFLTEQLNSTKVADMRSVLYNLYEEQAKTIMFANVRDEYIFKTIDPAFAPEEKESPRRALICILGAIGGFLISIFLVLVRLIYLQPRVL
ncbi:Wzz/FepE/Etk N-terminal domain-containing protein [Pseudoalteromonas agarivorans]|uniref:Wzz/FepE/Etk N-terminal domain-containing protein n=1 Tax=Pseudoalteromonas agarivorans TaxID=176102 RepID=UPI0003D59C73|nr:Wzz/FepE/Etk N-terminal domain-containing protein [Pseudoalteromonas agarivorans]ETJ48440.1 lipopolysaccharide biosynthesis protein [Pseudoalteromonas agarivorans]